MLVEDAPVGPDDEGLGHAVDAPFDRRAPGRDRRRRPNRGCRARPRKRRAFSGLVLVVHADARATRPGLHRRRFATARPGTGCSTRQGAHQLAKTLTMVAAAPVEIGHAEARAPAGRRAADPPARASVIAGAGLPISAEGTLLASPVNRARRGTPAPARRTGSAGSGRPAASAGPVRLAALARDRSCGSLMTRPCGAPAGAALLERRQRPLLRPVVAQDRRRSARRAPAPPRRRRRG